MTITLPTVPAPAERRTPTRRRRAYSPNGQVGHHLARAAELQLRIAELTALYDTERTWLQQHMESKSLTNLELGAVRVALKQRSRWTYSPATQREMQALAITQKWEQSQGIAENNPTSYVALTHLDQ